MTTTLPREDRAVAVSIVNYGTARMVLDALPALMEELARFTRSHVVIVDNCSPGDDGARLEAGVATLALAPSVEVIRSPVNGGFAAGNNVAFAAIRLLPWRPDGVFLLNPDAVATPGVLSALFAIFDAHPEAGFVGPRVDDPEGGSFSGAFRFPTLMTEVAKGLGIGALLRQFPTVIDETDAPVEVDWITGSACLIRGAAFEVLGDMDDGYFLYFDEVDYMLQGRRLGWTTWHAPDARVIHDAGAATGIAHGQARRGRQPDYWFQAWARYFSKNHGPAYARAVAIAKLAAMLAGFAQRRIRGKSVNRAEWFYLDFARKVVLGRLDPPPASDRAATPGGRAPVRSR